MAFAPPQVIDTPTTRQPLPFGLFSVATPVEPGDSRWENGVEWEPLTCAPASGIGDPSCDETPTPGLPKFFAPGGGLGEASAFTVYGSYKCSLFGRDLGAGQERATAQLLAREEARVEQALWTGDLGNDVNFTDAEDLTPGSGAVNPVQAIAALERFLATRYGSLGVIHMSRSAAVIALAEGALTADKSGRLWTKIGTPTVAGSGYEVNTGPDGSPATGGDKWAYATPSLFVYRGEIFTSSDRLGDLLDRGLNDLYAVAERRYLIGFDPCGVAAILFSEDGGEAS